MSLARGVFDVLMLVCAATDLAAYRILNGVVIALAILFFILAALHHQQVHWLDHIAVAVLCLAAGYVFFLFGSVGAGDAKLFAAVSLWAGLAGIVPLLLFVSLSGLAFALILLFARRCNVWWKKKPRALEAIADAPVLQPGAGVPFGVGIALGAVLATHFFPQWLWLF